MFWRKRKRDDWYDDDDFDYDEPDLSGYDEWYDEPDPYRRPSRRKWVLLSALIVLLGGALLAYGLFRPELAASPATITRTATAISSPTPVEPSATPSRPTPASPTPPPTILPPTEAPQTATAPTPTPVGQTYDPAVLRQNMLDLINRDRAANGLDRVEWDPVAARAGRLHAKDMVEFNYFSHWNRAGLGPDHRYTLAGGIHAVNENLHAYQYVYEDGRGAPIENWTEVIENAQEGLMNSPGHRANILNPAHTHVGIGMAYDAESGQFRLAQEFTNQYAHLAQPLPLEASLGQTVVVQGSMTGAELSNPLLALAYESFPDPLDVEALDQTGTYASAADNVDTRRISLAFEERLELDHEQKPGLYHVRLFVDLSTGQAMVMDWIVQVR